MPPTDKASDQTTRLMQTNKNSWKRFWQIISFTKVHQLVYSKVWVSNTTGWTVACHRSALLLVISNTYCLKIKSKVEFSQFSLLLSSTWGKTVLFRCHSVKLVGIRGMRISSCSIQINDAAWRGSTGAGMLHLRELRVLRWVVVRERDREDVGKLAYY